MPERTVFQSMSQRHVISLGPQATIWDAACLMTKANCGSVLIVDKRGGWEQMIEHGRTGWLCESPGDFIACATKMAWEPHYREDMAAAARERGLALGGLEASQESWRQVFDVIEEL